MLILSLDIPFVLCLREIFVQLPQEEYVRLLIEPIVSVEKKMKKNLNQCRNYKADYFINTEEIHMNEGDFYEWGWKCPTSRDEKSRFLNKMKDMASFVLKMHTWNTLFYVKNYMYKCMENSVERYSQSSDYFWEGDGHCRELKGDFGINPYCFNFYKNFLIVYYLITNK